MNPMYYLSFTSSLFLLGLWGIFLNRKNIDKNDSLESIDSPMVGIIYLTPKPSSPPFAKKGQKIKIFSTGQTFTVDQVGIFTPKKTEMDQLSAGQVGYMVAGIKDIYGAPVGDTIIESKDESTLPLPGFKKVLPKSLCILVYC